MSTAETTLRNVILDYRSNVVSIKRQSQYIDKAIPSCTKIKAQRRKIDRLQNIQKGTCSDALISDHLENKTIEKLLQQNQSLLNDKNNAIKRLNEERNESRKRYELIQEYKYNSDTSIDSNPKDDQIVTVSQVIGTNHNIIIGKLLSDLSETNVAQVGELKSLLKRQTREMERVLNELRKNGDVIKSQKNTIHQLLYEKNKALDGLAESKHNEMIIDNTLDNEKQKNSALQNEVSTLKEESKEFNLRMNRRMRQQTNMHRVERNKLKQGMEEWKNRYFEMRSACDQQTLTLRNNCLRMMGSINLTAK